MLRKQGSINMENEIFLALEEKAQYRLNSTVDVTFHIYTSPQALHALKQNPNRLAKKTNFLLLITPF